MKTIFVVDDNDTNLAAAEEALDSDYKVLTLPSAEKMFAMLEKIRPDIILLDIEMPHTDGFAALKTLKTDARYADIPVVFLTGRNDEATEAAGFSSGALDFVTKPFSAPVLKNRIKTHLGVEDVIRERTAQLRTLQQGLVLILADLLDSRDSATGGHIERASVYLKILTEAAIERGIYKSELQGVDPELWASSARLHDVGKIAVPDAILNKLASLSQEEFELVKAHPNAGGRIIDRITARTGSMPFLENAKLFAVSHHERWDGSGYPLGLKGTEIPLQGRLLAVADVYDALLSDRRYKKAYTEEDVERNIAGNAGKLFDPLITDVFLDAKEKLSAARRSFSEKEI